MHDRQTGLRAVSAAWAAFAAAGPTTLPMHAPICITGPSGPTGIEVLATKGEGSDGGKTGWGEGLRGEAWPNPVSSSNPGPNPGPDPNPSPLYLHDSIADPIFTARVSPSNDRGIWTPLRNVMT